VSGSVNKKMGYYDGKLITKEGMAKERVWEIQEVE
jgi:hypothetical protein